MFVFEREPVHFVELFCNGQQFKNQCSVVKVFHFSFRASIPCNLSLDFSLLEAFVIAVCFSIFLNQKQRQNPFCFSPEQITRVKSFPPNGNRILSRIYENYFPSADFKYSSENFALNYGKRRTFGQ